MERYTPIACSQHDQYLAWATLRQEIDVLYSDEADQERSATGRIMDVFTQQDRTEWMALDSGERIRLDRIRRTSVR
jgi:transcriptional antiterminator Rof (Rho-off)